MRNLFSDLHPASKLIYVLFIILTSFLITLLFALLIAIPLFHINLSDLSSTLSDYSNPNNLSFLKYLQSMQAFGLFILPAFIIAYLFRSDHYLAFNKKVNSKTIFISIFILVASIPIINSLGALNQSMQLPDWLSGIENWIKEKEENAQNITESFLVMNTLRGLLFNLFMLAVLPAIGEELIFRGILQRIFAEWTRNIHIGILIAGFLFSAMHFQFYGFLPRMILGILLGYLFYWSGSIWIPIVGHFTNNAIAVLFYYFYSDEMIHEVESFGFNQGSYGYLVMSIIVVSSALYLFYKDNKPIAKY